MERNNPLLTQARENIEKAQRERESIEEAKKHIPELRKKLDAFFVDEENKLVDGLYALRKSSPKDRTAKVRIGNVEVKKFRSDFMGNVVRETAYKDSHLRMGISLDILGEGEESVRVEMEKDSPFRDLDVYSDGPTTINVVPLDSVLKIYENGAQIESKAHNYEPFTSHTPMGSTGDRGPVWTRNMNMEDFENYNSLLDRLNEPDVRRVEK
jgi:hypothetical protein